MRIKAKNNRGRDSWAKDLSGLRFGRLVVQPGPERRTVSGVTRWFWHCQCDCGGRRTVYSGVLTRGGALSCGCLVKEERRQDWEVFEWLNGKIEIDFDTGCWLWTNGLHPNGYGKGSALVATRCRFAHRIAYLAMVGPIPPKLDLDHLCRVRRCVNPDHLEPVTRSVNLTRGLTGKFHRDRETCRRGHPMTEENTFHCIKMDKGRVYKARQCRTCVNLKRRERRAVQKLAAASDIIAQRNWGG